jgi:GrpB-like predicted nucleotidyltransferase (UPF0157 family)
LVVLMALPASVFSAGYSCPPWTVQGVSLRWLPTTRVGRIASTQSGGSSRRCCQGASSIEHVGSTSVPGLAAKPIIDIEVVVPEVEEIAAHVTGLERLGYVFRPLAFPDDGDHLFFVKDTDGKRTHHLHVFAARSPRPQENRVFRAYLAAHPEAARRYERAKRAAAQAHPDSRARYGEAKAAVFFELLEQSRLWSAQQAAVSTAARPPQQV